LDEPIPFGARSAVQLEFQRTNLNRTLVERDGIPVVGFLFGYLAPITNDLFYERHVAEPPVYE
jgi:hypothetical protein